MGKAKRWALYMIVFLRLLPPRFLVSHVPNRTPAVLLACPIFATLRYQFEIVLPPLPLIKAIDSFLLGNQGTQNLDVKMNIAAMLEPVHKAPCATMSPVSTSPSQQRLPSLMHATSQHAQLPGRASRPLPSMSALPPLSSLHPSPSPPHQVHHIDSGSSTGSYVNAPIQQRPLSAKHHERQHSTDNSTRRDSSASSSHIGATPRHRGKQTKAACIPCRKRKSKVLLSLLFPHHNISTQD